jgi:hypothetical protein
LASTTTLTRRRPTPPTDGAHLLDRELGGLLVIQVDVLRGVLGQLGSDAAREVLPRRLLGHSQRGADLLPRRSRLAGRPNLLIAQPVQLPHPDRSPAGLMAGKFSNDRS